MKTAPTGKHSGNNISILRYASSILFSSFKLLTNPIKSTQALNTWWFSFEILTKLYQKKLSCVCKQPLKRAQIFLDPFGKRFLSTNLIARKDYAKTSPTIMTTIVAGYRLFAAYHNSSVKLEGLTILQLDLPHRNYVC